MNLKYIVEDKNSDRTVKHILKNEMELSERLIKKLKYSSNILQNSSPVFVNSKVATGDIIEVNIDFVEDCSDIEPENIPIDIIYEDDYLIALNKQPNMVVHPTCGHLSGTIANAIVHHLNSKGISRKIRPVSRLDRDTSGVIIFAKNEYIQESLIRQMTSKTFKKEYLGIVHGRINEPSGTIDLPIARKPESIMLRHVSSEGDTAITHFEVLEYFNHGTLVKFSLETGRTHQIRVHCQAIGHALIGDTLYPSLTPENDNDFSQAINRQALHSFRSSFIHPFSKNETVLVADIPDDMNRLLEILRK